MCGTWSLLVWKGKNSYYDNIIDIFYYQAWDYLWLLSWGFCGYFLLHHFSLQEFVVSTLITGTWDSCINNSQLYSKYDRNIIRRMNYLNLKTYFLSLVATASSSINLVQPNRVVLVVEESTIKLTLVKLKLELFHPIFLDTDMASFIQAK